MFSLRKWVAGVARDAAIAERNEYAKSCAKEPVNIDSELDDGVILCYAYDHKLLPRKAWIKKAEAWQKEYDPPFGLAAMWRNVSMVYWGSSPESEPVIPYDLRRKIADYLLEARLQVATDELKVAKKAVGGKHNA